MSSLIIRHPWIFVSLAFVPFIVLAVVTVVGLYRLKNTESSITGGGLPNFSILLCSFCAPLYALIVGFVIAIPVSLLLEINSDHFLVILFHRYLAGFIGAWMVTFTYLCYFFFSMCLDAFKLSGVSLMEAVMRLINVTVVQFPKSIGLAILISFGCFAAVALVGEGGRYAWLFLDVLSYARKLQ
ncbi:MAG: hypothetical protein JSS83_19810 [Cyanobacteria bacterium SZAS LIN-3]|nr:hypothetical protein [Cyanobacteria bacterium SZAS LIN-3]